MVSNRSRAAQHNTRLPSRLNSPLENCDNEGARVKVAEAGDVQVAEGRHAAEGVHKRGVGDKVAVDCAALLLGGALGELADDVSDLLDWGGVSLGCFVLVLLLRSLVACPYLDAP